MTMPPEVYVIENKHGEWLAIAASAQHAESWLDKHPALRMHGYRLKRVFLVD